MALDEMDETEGAGGVAVVSAALTFSVLGTSVCAAPAGAEPFVDAF
tara:strand:+ start:258 stop:395 length:138 start_codon:yes stop_codon:yes gene_type:complete